MTADPSPVAAASVPANPDRDAVYVVGNVLGVISIVFGVISVLLGFIPLIGLMALIFAFVGGLWAVFGAIVLLVGKRGSLKLPLIGLVINVAAFLLCIVINIIAAVALSTTA